MVLVNSSKSVNSSQSAKLIVSSALFRDDLLISSFAKTVTNGESLHFQPKLTSSYVSKMSRNGDRVDPVIKSFEHGYDIKLTPRTQASGVIGIAVRVEGAEVIDLVSEEDDTDLTGPQILLIGSDLKLLANPGEEAHAEWGCEAPDDSSQLRFCRYNLIVTVDIIDRPARHLAPHQVSTPI
ncbi:hypothetical protein [Pseudomonas nicosulfuronedens]